MKKRLLAAFLALALCAGLAPVQAFATSIDDNSVFLKQSTNYTCTLTSAAMMLRRHAILDGNSSWNTITESSVRADAWTENVGLRYSFSHRGMNVATVSLNGSGYITVSDKTNYLISMLTVHPEGIVIYNKSHAVLLTDYDSSTNTFYCADPAGSLIGRIGLTSSTLSGSGQDGKIAKLTQIWYVSSGTAIGTGNPGGTGTAGRTSVPSVSVNGQSVSVAWSSDKVASSYDVYLIQDPWSWESIRYHISTQSQFCTFGNVAEGTYRAFTIARPNDDYTQSEWAPEFVVKRSHDTHTWGGGVVTQEPDRKSIGYKTFTCTVCGMTKLEIIDALDYTISYGTTEIKDCEFLSCHDLTAITIPNSVTRIGISAFQFSGLTGITIPGSVTEIGQEAFRECTNLSYATISDGVKKIGMGAFLGCDSLSSITIPGSMVEINSGTFSFCTSLTSVSLPSSIIRINSRAFSGCTGLKDVYYAGTKAQWDAITIGEGNGELRSATIHFASCTIHTYDNGRVTKAPTVHEAGMRTYTCTACGTTQTETIGALTSYTIPYGTTEVKGSEFMGCSNLTSITIPNSVTEIGVCAFWDCTSLTSIVIPNSVVAIRSGAFLDCSSLNSIVIPDSVVVIYSATFQNCTSLTSVTIPSSVKRIDYAAFDNCPNLKNVYYGGSELQWKAISADYRDGGNDALKTATIHFTECTSHTYDSGTVTKDSTMTDTGEMTYSCTVCGETKTEAIPKLDNPQKKFTDLSPTGFYLDAVAWALDKNVTTGTTGTTFSPKDNCTHGQILTFLWRAAGSPESNATLPFETTGKEYYLSAAKWAYEKGMIDKNFNHKTPCTRAYAVLYIWQAFGKPAATTASPFTDIPSHWSSAKAAAWAAEKGITTGTTATTFDPNKVCNRGEIVTFLYRAYRI